jgi:hypothetical protein
MSPPRTDALTAAQQQLVQEHMHMADCLAGITHNGPMRNVPEDALRSSAHMGLITAARTYKEGKKATFATHATVRIKGQFLDDARQFYKWSRGYRDNYKKMRVVHIEDLRWSATLNGCRDEGVGDAFDRVAQRHADSGLGEMIANDDIRHHLNKLGSPYSHVLYLHTYAGMTFKQIGKYFDRSESWACFAYHDAVEIAKSKLGPWLESLKCS